MTALIICRETNHEWALGLQGRKKFHHRDSDELRVLTPLRHCFKHFIEDYHSWHKRCAGEMSFQTWMIGAEYVANFKCHAELLLLGTITQSGDWPAPGAYDWTAQNQIAGNMGRTL